LSGLSERGLGGLDSLVELSNRLRQLGLAGLVRRGGELTDRLRPRQLQRFELSNLLRVPDGRPASLRAAERQFVHALLNSRVRINQTFAGVTHSESSSGSVKMKLRSL